MPTNADLIRASYEAFRNGDLESALALFAPDISWTHPDGMSDYGLGGTKKGHEEVLAFMKRARSLFAEIRPMPREFVEAGNRVMVLGTHVMRAHTGRSCRVEFVQSWVLADGKATHFTDFHDTAPIRRLFEPVAQEGPWQVIRTGLRFWESRVLLSAVELGVFTVLAEGPLGLDALTARLELHPRGTRDFLDTLVALGFLERDGTTYRNTPLSNKYLDTRNPETDVGGLLEVADALWYDSWRNLTAALRTGQPQNQATVGEGDPFEVLYADPVRVEKFQRAMQGGSVGAMSALSEKFSWSNYQSVADIGCAGGALLRGLFTTHSHLRGIGFDLPPVASSFQATVARAGLSDRLTFWPGNFFTDPLPAADVIVFGHVLHDWDLSTKQSLLHKAFEALSTGGVVIVYDMLIDDERRQNVLGLLMSLHMLLESPGGFDYTGEDCLEWLVDAGFRDCYVEHLSGPESMVVGFKR